LNLEKLSLKWQVFAALVFFVILLLAFLWLFQTVFLEKFYEGIQTRNVRALASYTAKSLSAGDLPQNFTNFIRQSEACIRVVDVYGRTVYSVEADLECSIHKFNYPKLREYFLKAAEGPSLEYYAQYSMGIDPGRGYVVSQKRRQLQSLVCAQTTTRDGISYLVLVEAMISPVEATVDTLRHQLIFITVIVLAVAVILAFFLSRRIAAPIIHINESARELARGRYDIDFSGRGYLEIKELSDTLNHAAGELAKVDNLRRELIANVSHDLRTPLTMITGYGEVMRDVPGENSAANVQVIIDEAQRLSRLVSDLLDISRLQAGAQELQPRVFELTQSLEVILNRFTKFTEQSGYRIDFWAEEKLFVLADEVKISQVFYNLISNAIHYTGTDRLVTIRQSRTERDTALIEVIDTGEGIPEAELPHIWDRYYKVDKSHRQFDVGSGLGLSIVKTVLEAHHAPFGARSGETGTVFWFELPLAENDEKDEN
jgi:signal transduction histidine kinase